MSMLPKLPKKFSKIWIQLLNLEQTLFPEIKEQLGILSEKEKRLIRVLDFANIILGVIGGDLVDGVHDLQVGST